MKKFVAFCGSLGLFLLNHPMTALAAEEAAGETAAVPLWLCVPFAGLLLCIAVLPLLKAEWWEAHQPHAVVFWSLLFMLPFAALFGAGEAAETVLECLVNDYLTFIILLFGLFCVSGNITMSGDLAGSPRINVGLLALGTLLSSWIGTTGASMLMIRPIIKMNAWRKKRRHIIIFFIFMVSNMGGCLTPIGDPPLLMGFMRGVPFFWSLHLLPVLLFNMVILLFIFYKLDMRAYRSDVAAGLKPDISKPGTEVKLKGAHNLLFLVMIVAAVILSGTLPGMPMFQDAEGNVLGIRIFGEVVLGWPSVIEIAIILAAAWLSFKTTNVSIRRENHFTWSAIREVAVLFVGIFITMQPALMLLQANGSELGITEPFHVLGNGPSVKLSGQHADVPGVFNDGRFPWILKRNGHGAWNGAGKDAPCDFGGRRVHGSQYIYRKRAELHGKVHRRRERYPDAVVFRLPSVVDSGSDACVSD